MNPSTMKALFKSVYGSSLASHIREHRMQHAAKLLLEGDENVAQVARAVGYESQSKFSTEFHRPSASCRRSTGDRRKSS